MRYKKCVKSETCWSELFIIYCGFLMDKISDSASCYNDTENIVLYVNLKILSSVQFTVIDRGSLYINYTHISCVVTKFD